MAFGTRVRFEPVREVAFGSVGASYTALGNPTSDHTRLFSVNNGTNADVYVSFDGTTNHLRVAANSFQLFDFSSNKVRDDGFFVDAGTTFYIKRVSAAPTMGSLWVEVAYASGGV